MFCVEVCDEVGVVTVSGLSASDHWVCVEFLESFNVLFFGTRVKRSRVADLRMLLNIAAAPLASM